MTYLPCCLNPPPHTPIIPCDEGGSLAGQVQCKLLVTTPLGTTYIQFSLSLYITTQVISEIS